MMVDHRVRTYVAVYVKKHCDSKIEKLKEEIKDLRNIIKGLKKDISELNRICR
jgi:prefoldin subunit 5